MRHCSFLLHNHHITTVAQSMTYHFGGVRGRWPNWSCQAAIRAGVVLSGGGPTSSFDMGSINFVPKS